MLSLFGYFLLLGGVTGLQTIKKDVVIVGGGSSGIYAGIQLLDHGKDVAIIERSGFIGSHVNSYYDPKTGQPLNAGVQTFHNNSVVRSYLQRLNVTARRESMPSYPTVYVDFVEGQAESNYTSPSFSDILQGLETYRDILAENYTYLEKGFFLPDPIPDELFLPFSEFAAKYGIEAIIPTLLEVIAPVEIWKEPTLYVIENFGHESAVTFIESLTTGVYRPHDMADVYRNAGAILGSRVLLNSTVQSVRRSASNVFIVANTPNGIICIEAKQIIMAAPPLLRNFQGWDLSADEASLFGKFRSKDVHVIIFRNSALNTTSYTAVGPNSTAWNDVLLPSLISISPTNFSDASYYAYLGAPYEISIPDAQALFMHQITTLQSNGAMPVGKTEIVEWWNHNSYMNYVSDDDIKAGFYTDLNALQGNSNTFYTGAVWSGQDSSTIWPAIENLLPQILAKL